MSDEYTDAATIERLRLRLDEARAEAERLALEVMGWKAEGRSSEEYLAEARAEIERLKADLLTLSNQQPNRCPMCPMTEATNE